MGLKNVATSLRARRRSLNQLREIRGLDWPWSPPPRGTNSSSPCPKVCPWNAVFCSKHSGPTLYLHQLPRVWGVPFPRPKTSSQNLEMGDISFNNSTILITQRFTVKLLVQRFGATPMERLIFLLVELELEVPSLDRANTSSP